MDQIEMLRQSLAAYQQDPRKPHSELISTRLPETPAKGSAPAQWTVVNEDVVKTMARLTGRIGVMNFASPTTPGGGVEYGAQAQEESIAKCTYLLPALRAFEATYYQPNRRNANSGLFSSALIYSASVRQVFDERGRELPDHFVDVVTVAAPNRSAYPALTEAATGPDIALKISQTLRAFKQHGTDHLILGAFGGGVFGNPLKQVALIFRQQLLRPEFNGAFPVIVFSIYDPDGGRVQTFEDALSGRSN
ncbi:TIGR02452 family protein [Lacticaseibacillus hegangensis]|uniref:TIGR02452 family protein n=1 Tax=Lacticaseibacillus hegangensis TaxID=2486010 RepID=A0ABW4CST3_9LACO|nr:TIGR02452 family protein [Lacticaseibacillus hegangensis]